MTTVIDISTTTAEKYRMFSATSPVLAMVSGGADSVALLHLLASGALGEQPLRVLHVNHLLRGEAADGDERFVRELGERLGIEVVAARYDVAAYAEAEGLNLEDAGRRVRYRFAEDELDAWCAELGRHASLGRIAVAHTLDDRIETFFMRALFGSGTGGLGSIAAVRDRIVRPLIEVERIALREWLGELGEEWREDVTNGDTSRLRARVRAAMLPAAEQVNLAYRAAMSRTMDLLSDDDALLGSMADAFTRDFAEVREGEEVAFERGLMATLDRTMARRTVRSALMRAFPEASRIEADHVEMLVDGLSGDAFAHDLPGGLRAFSEYDRLIICYADAHIPTVAPHLLLLEGTTILGEAGKIVAEAADPREFSGDGHSIVIDARRIVGQLVVDSVRPGDRIRPLGMEGTRKVSDLLVDAKVPRRLRSAVPVVRDGEEIVWVAGVRMSDDYRLGDETTEAIRLTWQSKELG